MKENDEDRRMYEINILRLYTIWLQKTGYDPQSGDGDVLIEYFYEDTFSFMNFDILSYVLNGHNLMNSYPKNKTMNENDRVIDSSIQALAWELDALSNDLFDFDFVDEDGIDEFEDECSSIREKHASDCAEAYVDEMNKFIDGYKKKKRGIDNEQSK